MPKRDIQVILDDILDEIERIERFTKDIYKEEEFVANELVFYAVLKSLENIGEAVKQIPVNLRDLYHFEWRKVSGLRDIIIHEYFGIDASIIWDVVRDKLPELRLAVSALKDIVKSQNSAS